MERLPLLVRQRHAHLLYRGTEQIRCITVPNRGGNEAVAADFDAPTERMESITPLLYQSGYVTIKGYDEMFQIYTQDIPNAEVRIGMMRSLIP